MNETLLDQHVEDEPVNRPGVFARIDETHFIEVWHRFRDDPNTPVSVVFDMESNDPNVDDLAVFEPRYRTNKGGMWGRLTVIYHHAHELELGGDDKEEGFDVELIPIDGDVFVVGLPDTVNVTDEDACAVAA